MVDAGLHQYHVPPDVLEGFPGTEVVAPKTWFAGGKMRKRWRDEEGKIYEWDYQHGAVERYSSRGIHEGEFDHRTGKMLKGPEEGRKVEV